MAAIGVLILHGVGPSATIPLFLTKGLFQAAVAGAPDPTVYGGHGEAFSRKRETFNRIDAFPSQRADRFGGTREIFPRTKGF